MLSAILKKRRVDDLAWAALMAACLGGYCDGLDASLYVIALFPAMSDLLGTTAHSTVGLVGSWVLATFMVGWAVGAVVFGILSDYIGRVRTMVITILLYALATGLCAASQNWEQLAFFRFLVGCGIGGEMGCGAVLIAEYFRGNARLHAAGIMGVFISAGFMSSAVVNLVLGNLGWRYIFLAGVLPALVTLYIRARVKEPEQFEKDRQGKEPQKFPLPQLFNAENRRNTFVVMAMASTAIVTWWAVLSWIPAWINQLTGTLAVEERSAAGFCLNLGGCVSAALIGYMVSRLGRALTFRLAFAGSLISIITMFLTVKSYSPVLPVWCTVAGFFAVIPFIALFIYVPEIFAMRIRGTAFGFGVNFGRLLAAAAALLGGQLISFFGGSYATAAMTIALVNVVGLIATLFMPDADAPTVLESEFAKFAPKAEPAPLPVRVVGSSNSMP